jgi:hypothetical protein
MDFQEFVLGPQILTFQLYDIDSTDATCSNSAGIISAFLPNDFGPSRQYDRLRIIKEIVADEGLLPDGDFKSLIHTDPSAKKTANRRMIIISTWRCHVTPILAVETACSVTDAHIMR